jgi:hypothetical protein
VERKRKTIEEDKWDEYFHYIKGECPWSLSAWKRGTLLITHWKGKPVELGDLEGIVYVHTNASARLLKKLEQRLNSRDENCEYLYSHPTFRHYSAPFPCLIQQDRAYLRYLRDKLDK